MIYIQERGSGKLVPENQDLFDEFTSRGYPVHLFTEKLLARRRLPLDKTCLVAGDVPVVVAALKQLQVPVPVPNDYPECLRPFLRRTVWETTLGAVRDRVYRDDFKPFFIKPKEHLKRFTGKVIESIYDLGSLSSVSKQTPVFCSELVTWLSEYRVFVVAGEVKGIRHYKGDPAERVDDAVIESTINKLESSGQATAAYGIDFGVLDDGATTLIELNDGYALGSYELNRVIYADLILARWEEITAEN